MADYRFIPKRLLAMRLNKKWLQKDLAEAAGLTQQQVSKWERGVREPKVNTLARAASALGVGMGEFFGEEETT